MAVLLAPRPVPPVPRPPEATPAVLDTSRPALARLVNYWVGLLVVGSGLGWCSAGSG